MRCVRCLFHQCSHEQCECNCHRKRDGPCDICADSGPHNKQFCGEVACQIALVDKLKAYGRFIVESEQDIINANKGKAMPEDA